MTHTQNDHPVRQGMAGLTTMAAAALLLIAGILAFLQGLSAVLNDEIFVEGPRYVFQFDTTAWGWIHIVIGVLGVLIAAGMMTGAMWARAAAIWIAALSIIANFLWLPYYPWWSVLVIAIDVLVIWAVATWRTD